jgi:3,4-dihydroxy 2-butanone 4-phosphate synthase/GTP cyclohydrolase II
VLQDNTVGHRLARADGDFRVVVLDRGAEPNPPCAAVWGNPTDNCLVRIQSRCLYGEIFGSTNCDCRAQLERSIALIRDEGNGVIVYLDQEGRGAGLLNKARGYRVSQEQGLDTYASYAHLGLPADTRSFADAAELLQRLNLTSVRLLTNNPDKVEGLRSAGIGVTRELLLDDIPSEYALDYLAAKEAHGHRFTRS